MQWGPQQEVALNRVGAWLRTRDKPYFTLGGYAGTGKTTLARHLTETVEGRVLFAAPTGKAALALQKSGAGDVSTIHKLIYKPKDKSQKRLKDLEMERAQLNQRNPIPEVLLRKVEEAIRIETENLRRPMFALNTEDSSLTGARLLVLDECWMINEEMGQDLLSFDVPILALGDPGQLKPVSGNSFFNPTPDFLLTEIHRQAADNPIIWLSKEVREGRPLAPGSYGESLVLRLSDLSREEIAGYVREAEQLLVGRNATRASSNQRMRELDGRSTPYPEIGDKLVCLRNNHEFGLLNGQIWWSTSNAQDVDDQTLMVDIEDDDGNRLEVLMHKAYFTGGQPAHWDIKNAECFDFGNALTVHKAQGSQWDHVAGFDEWNGRDRQQWLYTLVTRAAEQLRLIQMWA